MGQDAINQRLKILIEALGMNIRSFSKKLGVSDSTTRNYIDKGSKPPADYIAQVASSIERINPAWLLLGKGEMFLTGTPEVQVLDVKRPDAQSDCERDLASALREVEQLKQLLAAKDELLAAKEEVLALLRKGA